MFDHRNLVYVCTMLECIEKAFIYSEAFSNASDFLWENSQINFNATWGLLLVVGEESKKITPELKQEYKSIPWSQLAGMRNYLAHDYRGVDYELVFKTVRAELPALKEILINMIDRIGYEKGALQEALDSPYYQHIQYLREKLND